MTKYDIAIIGSGLGGLVSALILGKEGKKVCVLEQHSIAGGNLQSFTRDGCVFDTGMHYIGSMGEGQYLRKYFDYLGISDRLNLIRLDDKGYDTLTFEGDNTEYPMSQGYELFRAHMLEYFPKEKKAIDAYVDKIRHVTAEFPLYNISKAKTYKLRPEVLGECATGFLHGITDNERLKNVLAGGLSLYAGYPDRTPLYIHACMRDSLVSSCWRPVDGSQQIAARLVEGIQAQGGEVLTSHKIAELQIENDQVVAAEAENGNTVHADAFISNAHPATTLGMIGEGKIRKIYRKRIMSLENTWGVFTLYAVLKPESLPYLNKNYFHYNSRGILHARHEEDHWPDNYYFYTPASSHSETHAESIVVMADMRFDEVKKWQNTSLNRRGEEYKHFKHQKAEMIINALERRLPGIREKIVKYYTSTPLTFRDYTGTHEGSAYGIMKDCHDPVRSIIQPRSKISNLYFTGQNLNLYGILGVTAAAVITCSEIVGMEYLSKKIADGR